MNEVDFRKAKKDAASGQKVGVFFVVILIIIAIIIAVSVPEFCINPKTGEDCSLLDYFLEWLRENTSYLFE